MLVTDAARYMQRAAKGLKIFYANVLHVTCLCHALHRVSECLRDQYGIVDELIAQTKHVFSKAPRRVAEYKRMFPELQLVPRPVITRWGTWIEAAIFYATNFESVKAVIFILQL